MTPAFSRVPRWLFVFGLAALASTVQHGTAQAQFFDPFSQFFAPQGAVYAPPVTARRNSRFTRRSRAVLVWVPDRPRIRRSRRPERVRHASLHYPAPVRARRESALASAKEQIRDDGKTKLIPRGPTGDPVAALMKDPTLRRGDVVVMPGGAKVFKGAARAPYRPSDFDDVRRTKLVGEKIRRQLAAMPIQPLASRGEAEIAERLSDKQDGDQNPQVAATGSLPRKVGP